MIRSLLVIALTAVFAPVFSQNNIKTDVLVVGNGNPAVAAAFQAALSNVKTTILTNETSFDVQFDEENKSSGIEQYFFEHYRKSKNIKDLTQKVNLNKEELNSALKVWADSLKNLTLFKGMGWDKFEKSGSGWQVKLSDGRTIKASVLVYATATNLGSLIYSSSEIKTPLDYNTTLYRTSLAGNNNKEPSFISLYNLIKPEFENVVFANGEGADLFAGQAAGATAAYSAFFRTKTSLSNLKRIQGELLAFKLSLMPFDDITTADSSWRAIQAVGLSGILKAEIKDGRAWFMPDRPVTYKEIKDPIKEYYYKAQLWFDDHIDVPINFENTVSLLSYVGNKSPQTTKETIQKLWKSSYKFNSELSPQKVLTRREFAVLINEYLKPFDVHIDKAGRVIR